MDVPADAEDLQKEHVVMCLRRVNKDKEESFSVLVHTKDLQTKTLKCACGYSFGESKSVYSRGVSIKLNLTRKPTRYE